MAAAAAVVMRVRQLVMAAGHMVAVTLVVVTAAVAAAVVAANITDIRLRGEVITLATN
jgi:hypothetical protein